MLPFLVELAGEPDVTVREHLLGTLPEIAGAAVDDSGRPDPGWERVWSEQVPRLLALRDDPDIGVRRLRLLALATTQAPSDVARVVAELRDDWHREPDDLTRIDLAHTISRLAGFEAAYQIRAWLIGMLDQGDPETRLGAAAVLATHDPAPLRAQEVLADAVRAGDVPHWERTNWLADPSRSIADWITGAPGRLGRRIDQCLERLDDPDDETRVRAVRDAALVLATWRSPEEVLLPAIAARLGDGSGEARAYAIHMVAACGPASAPYADQVAELVGDESPASPHADETIGDLAVWALARIGDHRCVGDLRDQVRGARPGFSVWSSAGGHPQFYMLDMPAMHQVLGPLREYAPALLPAVRERLRTTDDFQWHREMAQTLQAWEGDGAEAVPELIDVLATDAAGWAAYALGSMGPAASDALPALRRLARGPGWKDRVSSRLTDQTRGRLELPGPGRRPAFDAGNRLQAAWACARVADDVELAVRVLAAGLDSGLRSGCSPAWDRCSSWTHRKTERPGTTARRRRRRLGPARRRAGALAADRRSRRRSPADGRDPAAAGAGLLRDPDAPRGRLRR